VDLDFVTEGVLAGASRPRLGSGEGTKGGEGDLPQLKERGVVGLVSLTEAPLDEEELRRAGLEYLHLPVPDFQAPRPEDIAAFVGFVREVTARRRGAVAVHCAAGYGRTGTMLACFLVSEGWGADEAIREVRRVRPGSIETESQEEAVRAWESRASGKP
jgi:atypical dual specificity phosphatase